MAEVKKAKDTEAEVTKEVLDGATEEVSTDTHEADSEGKTTKVKATAKAGKRSAKAIKEAEELEAKKARKEEATSADKPAPKPVTKTRSLLERRGKKYREAAKLVDSDKLYALDEAVALVSKISTTSFDATVELHVRLGVDPRQADQNIRQMVVLPHGSGKTLRVAVFAEADQHAAAKKAGADVVGADEFLQQLDKEDLNFDVLISTPSLMAKLGKYAKLLGPKGLMPNPKSGTVAKDVAKAVSDAKAGRIEYRVDNGGNVHAGIGKTSFETKQILENAEAVMSSIRAAKPASVKGNYLISAHMSTSMGPSIKLSI
jgi:large subunit ribosomal protein L1